MKEIKILTTRKQSLNHVAYDTVLGLEREFCECMNQEDSLYYFKRRSLMDKIIRKLFDRSIVDKALVKKVEDTQAYFFYACMGIGYLKANISTLEKIHAKLILYVFDCWEPDWPMWKEIFDRMKPAYIFFAYKKASVYFDTLYGNCFWLPQSMDVQYYHDYQQPKKRLFMQMGRRTPMLHEYVLRYLKNHQLENDEKNYIYEKEKGVIIFPETQTLAREINASKFFLAAPKNITAQQSTGDISEVTARFYEAMACKSLVVGIKPTDTFDELFPYENAMIEVTSENFDEMIDSLNRDEIQYQTIVDKNYDYVMKHHRWKNRYEQVLNVLAQME